MKENLNYLLIIGLSVMLTSLARNYTNDKDLIIEDGSVGIGTTMPFTQFHIQRPLGHPNGSTIQLQYGPVASQYSQNASGGAFNLRNADNSIQAIFRSYGDTFFNKEIGNVGIGVEFPSSKLEVSGGDLHLSDNDSGIVLTSATGDCYKLTVTTSGTLSVAPITCP